MFFNTVLQGANSLMWLIEVSTRENLGQGFNDHKAESLPLRYMPTALGFCNELR